MRKLCLVVLCGLLVASLAPIANADYLGASGSSYTSKTPSTGGHLPPVSNSRNGTTTVVDISYTASWDALGDASNVVMVLDIAGLTGFGTGNGVTMNGIGWDVELYTYGGSWLSEARMYFDDNIAPDAFGLFLTPGVGDLFPGQASYSSGGIIQLSDQGIPDILLPDGYLRLEFHETFDDGDGGPIDGDGA